MVLRLFTMNARRGDCEECAVVAVKAMTGGKTNRAAGTLRAGRIRAGA